MTAAGGTGAVNLGTVLDIMEQAQPTATALHQQAVGSTRAEVADINRALLHLADQFDLAAALVRNEYWNARGAPAYDL